MLTAFHFLARAALTSLFALHSLARTELSPCSQEAQGLTVAPSGAGRPGPACLCRAAASSATPSARTGDRLVPRGVASPGKLCHERGAERVSRGCSRLPPPARRPAPLGARGCGRRPREAWRAARGGGPRVRRPPSSAPWGRDDARAPRDPATWRPLACPPRPRLLFPPPSPPPVTVSLSKMRSHGRAPSADLPLRPRTPPRPGASAGRRGSVVKRSARSFHHVHLKSEFGFLGLSTYSPASHTWRSP